MQSNWGASCPSVSVVHGAVPGRARLRVVGLLNCPELKAALESALPGSDGIQRATASTITSNVLVYYDPHQELRRLVGLVELTVRSVDLSELRTAREARPPQAARGRLSAERLSLPGFLRSLWQSAFQRQEAAGEARLRPAAEQPQLAWHTLPAQDVLRFWATARAAGLSPAAASERLIQYGPNVLPHPEPRSAARIFAGQFQSLPVVLLLASAAVSVLTGGAGDAVVIVAVVLLNAVIGAMTEFEAERTITSLMTLSEPVATIIRGRELLQIGAEQVVPGDLLVLTRGCHVVADARLVEAENLTADESALTGESVAVEKRVQALAGGNLPLADRLNVVYRGTVIAGGSGIAVVFATGRHTQIGCVQELISAAAQPLTPLQRQMETLGRQLVWLTALVSGAVFVVGLLRGYSALQMLRSAVSLAVAAVPEGLPAVATVSLANAVRSMVAQGVLVRRLDAIEALGAVQVVCFDKTGTLTLNEMSVVASSVDSRRYNVSGGAFLADGKPVQMTRHPELLRLLEICSLCSEAAVTEDEGVLAASGTGTEAALVRMALNSGIDVRLLRRRHPLRRTVHRARGRNYMITVHDAGAGRRLLAVKGSPSEVLKLSGRKARNGKTEPLGAAGRRLIEAENDRMAGAGLRVLGVAYGETAEESFGRDRNLVWLGLVGIADPPRHGLSDLLEDFRRAGIRPVMATGDQGATARAIGTSLGLNGSSQLDVVDAAELPGLAGSRLQERISGAQIFSRVSPAQKLEIVQALQRSGQVVAMTGDGINDGPALRAADIGVALGQTGTRVAREVADILLTDDNIHALLPAIREGRRVRGNIHRAIHYISATNMGEILLMFGALSTGLGQPLSARQLLWINLLTDVFPELALALGPADAGIMNRPPADTRVPMIGRPEYRQLGLQSSIMAGVSLAAYAYGVARYGIGPGASTMAFLTLTSAQLLHAITEARPRGSGFDISQPPQNQYLWMSLAAGFAALTLSQFGLTSLLGTARIGAADALVCASAALASWLANEAVKPPLPETPLTPLLEPA